MGYCRTRDNMPEGCNYWRAKDCSTYTSTETCESAPDGEDSCCQWVGPETDIPGCMDPYAPNYNSKATSDDGTCLPPLDVQWGIIGILGFGVLQFIVTVVALIMVGSCIGIKNSTPDQWLFAMCPCTNWCYVIYLLASGRCA